jgi:hypothetical protein
MPASSCSLVTGRDRARGGAGSCGSRWPRPARRAEAARLGCAGSPSGDSPWPHGRSAAGRSQQVVDARTREVTRSARRLILHLPAGWPWAAWFELTLARLRCVAYAADTAMKTRRHGSIAALENGGCEPSRRCDHAFSTPPGRFQPTPEHPKSTPEIRHRWIQAKPETSSNRRLVGPGCLPRDCSRSWV